MAAAEWKQVNAPTRRTKDSTLEVKVLLLNKVDSLTKRINNVSIQEFTEQLVMLTKLMNTGHSMKTVRWWMIHLDCALMLIKRRVLVRCGHTLARTCLIRCGNHTVRKTTVTTLTSKIPTTVSMQEVSHSKLILKLAHLPPLRNSNGSTTTGNLLKLTGSKDLATLAVAWRSNFLHQCLIPRKWANRWLLLYLRPWKLVFSSSVSNLLQPYQALFPRCLQLQLRKLWQLHLLVITTKMELLSQLGASIN